MHRVVATPNLLVIRLASSKDYSAVELIVMGASGTWAALALRSLCDGHHKKAFLNVELPRKTRAFLIAPVLSGISSDLIKSQWTMDHCRRRRSASALMHNRDDGPNMETYHERTYRSSRFGHADCGADIRSTCERGSDVAGDLLIRL